MNTALVPSPNIYRPTKNQTAGHHLESIAGEKAESTPALAAIHAALLAFVEHDDYPCVGAKSAIHRNAYRLGNYGPLASPEGIEQTTRDLQWFAATADEIDPHYATMLTVFDGPAIKDERHFESLMWKHLQGMNRIDALNYRWDPSVSIDPCDPDFSYSIGGSAFFIVGMHPAASRQARRFPYPTLVWNLHAQFERLREVGQFESFKAVIRQRDEQLQGSANPEQADHGDLSEARQYSGRPHAAEWRCPFHPVQQPPVEQSPIEQPGARQ